MKVLPGELRTLRHIASRLQSVVRQRTRLINQFHLLLTSTFPELALLVNDIASAWVLTLCERYPTAKLLAAASTQDLRQITYLPDKLIDPLLEHAGTAFASLEGDPVAELVRDQVSQLRHARARQLRLEKTLVLIGQRHFLSWVKIVAVSRYYSCTSLTHFEKWRCPIKKS